MHPLPDLPWQVVATDCFETTGHHYCVFICAHSDCIDICELKDLTAQTLVNKTKQLFATHGIPVTLISDNGPNYAVRDFADFARSWDFLRITSSLHHSQSNGRAEAAVKNMKNVIKKAIGGRQCLNGGTQSLQEQTVDQSKDWCHVALDHSCPVTRACTNHMINRTSPSRSSIRIVVPSNSMTAMLSHCQNLSQDSPSEPNFTLKITTVTGNPV